MKKITIIIAMLLISICLYGQENKIEDIITKIDDASIKSIIINQHGGKFQKSEDIVIYGKPTKSYTYVLSNWKGIGNCKYISYYSANGSIIGFEFYFIPSISKNEILNNFPNNKFITDEKFDGGGLPAIKNIYKENRNNLTMSLSAYTSNPNLIVILTFYKMDLDKK